MSLLVLGQAIACQCVGKRFANFMQQESIRTIVGKSISTMRCSRCKKTVKFVLKHRLGRRVEL